MATTATAVVPDALATSRALLQALFAAGAPRDFAVRFWDGSVWYPDASRSPRFTLVLNHPGALRSLLLPPSELRLGEAYIYGDVDLQGDLQAVFPVAEAILAGGLPLVERLGLVRRLLALPASPHPFPNGAGSRMRGRRHSLQRDRAAVTYHYDVSNDFYRLWLDQRLVYSCAYFERPEVELDQAQLAKLDYLCRKLRLQPGQRLLDIGCGWGGLLLYAVERYGVEAVGITLSRQQAELAAQSIVAAGLASRCRVELRDYRELAGGEQFDRIVSVGMFEHVGRARLPEYFRRAWQLLRPGGVFLNHGIARMDGGRARPSSSFVARYVFPDGELEPISQALNAAEAAGFEVRDVESLREHYALTLDHWVRRLEARHQEAVAAADEVTYRIWRLYMAGSARAFRGGRINVYQTLLAKPERGQSGLPLTRADWYRD